ncbi:MAG: [FeFe] hydrogenase H-cluster radical SAM maturase HydE [Treponema sp.]|nr:[FeFe] hydrogenase H-cluster radical SAM maturase HydE [Treponema sp.]
MTEQIRALIKKLFDNHSLSMPEYEELVRTRDSESSALARELAVKVRRKKYGTDVFIRGLIEFSNHCKNDCYYCGIRKSNSQCTRYRLSAEEIISCVHEGYSLGFRTFVLQSGEDPFFTDDVLCPIISGIKNAHPDCAITLSLGERNLQSYRALFNAGADRYLLRHETASAEHYKKLHPATMSFSHRIECLHMLRETGYAVGVGFMVGSPFQTAAELARDLKFIETFQPEMCGIGPFIPHHNTPFAREESGSVELTCFLLSLVRLIKPNVLLPATTALGTLAPNGRELGILSGANVIMPNLSPVGVRKKYELYNGKICTNEESAQCRSCLDRRIDSIGYRTVVSRGDMA